MVLSCKEFVRHNFLELSKFFDTLTYLVQSDLVLSKSVILSPFRLPNFEIDSQNRTENIPTSENVRERPGRRKQLPTSGIFWVKNALNFQIMLKISIINCLVYDFFIP